VQLADRREIGRVTARPGDLLLSVLPAGEALTSSLHPQAPPPPNRAGRRAGAFLFIALHAVSDIGITGLLGAKIASFGSRHDPGVSYTLFLQNNAVRARSA